MAERLLEEGISALEKRILVQIHNRRGFVSDPEVGGGPGGGPPGDLPIAPAAAGVAVVAAPAAAPRTAGVRLPVSDGFGFRAHALKPLLEVENEGPSNRGEGQAGAAAPGSAPTPAPAAANAPAAAAAPGGTQPAGSTSSREGGGGDGTPGGSLHSLGAGGSGHGLSVLQQRMQQAYQVSDGK